MCYVKFQSSETYMFFPKPESYLIPQHTENVCEVFKAVPLKGKEQAKKKGLLQSLIVKC